MQKKKIEKIDNLFLKNRMRIDDIVKEMKKEIATIKELDKKKEKS